MDFMTLSGQTYAFTAPTLTRTGLPPITYGSIEFLDLGATDYDDVFTITSTRPGTTVFLDGLGGDNILNGPNTPTTWEFAGGGGFLDVLPTSRVNFLLMTTLNGGTGDDVFRAALGSDFIGFISGGGGVNELDYSLYSTDVYVNLQTNAATGVSLGYTGIQNVTGGAGNDILVGDDQSNVLSGNAGRNVLIGGGSGYTLQPDTLVGGIGEDLLIAGYTSYDTSVADLTAIRNMWARPDLPQSRRITNLTGGMGVPALNATTVFSNYARNIVLGRGALDFFFGRRTTFADITDWDSATETFLDIF
jgi:Ca2+-binding RTX toxin-like protein